VVETLAPSYATGVHARWEFARETMADLPGGAEWLMDLESEYDEADRPWAVHEGHMIAVSERDREVVAQAGPAILQSGWTGDAEHVHARATAARDGGVTELVFGPTGPDVERELAAFAAAVRGGG
jgi:5,10-methylenetetrahydromethanopterin reductase